MITPILIQLFEQGLTKLSNEIDQYPDDASLWIPLEGITNAGGNLCLHLNGNLQHFLGAVLNDSGYVRNRDAEFSLKNISKKKLLDEVEATKMSVRDTLEQLSKKTLEQTYPIQLFDEPVTTEYMLVYLLSHLNYHIGQINYHRRLAATKVAATQA
ncbi:DUF1572 family protein [Pseudoflavitalea sp. G-6-1-2]|uniref:DUF1572 family protein n=1 Tax=Pseudoflavitalea sp. G-6-1-2 TaxID=2728841 RepID=UPI00146D6F12|nr:DUF1572 family protein [Pseudoflavitalea sp. G-6-1-2]NML23087.1 DUF1572 family protein [Pseudoflavitalea sp. G-6-1-2]